MNSDQHIDIALQENSILSNLPAQHLSTVVIHNSLQEGNRIDGILLTWFPTRRADSQSEGLLSKIDSNLCPATWITEKIIKSIVRYKYHDNAWWVTMPECQSVIPQAIKYWIKNSEHQIKFREQKKQFKKTLKVESTISQQTKDNTGHTNPRSYHQPRHTTQIKQKTLVQKNCNKNLNHFSKFKE